jgi:hypothetical protein
MKRFFLVLPIGLFISAFAFAQVGINLIGRATQEMDTPGLSAAPSNPTIAVGSTVTIVNTDTGEEINVTVSDKISASPNRIVDLSREVWDRLKIGPDTLVRVISPARNQSAAAAPPPAPAPSPPPPPPAAAPSPPPAVDPPPPPPTTAFIPDDDPEDDLEFDVMAWEDDDIVEVADIIEADSADDTEIVEDIVVIAPPVRQIEERVPVSPPPPPLPPPPPPSSGSSSLPAFAQSLYHLLILDRTHCAANADIGTQKIEVLYNFKDGRNGYLVALYTSAQATPVLPVGARVLADLATENKSAIREYVNSSAFKRFVANPQVISQLQNMLEESTANFLGNIKIIPSLPNPNSGKTYRLQVGAFSVADSAARTMQQLRALGLNAAQEQHGSLLRVSAVGVRAADVQSAVQKLEAAGFKEVWIRE